MNKMMPQSLSEKANEGKTNKIILEGREAVEIILLLKQYFGVLIYPWKQVK